MGGSEDNFERTGDCESRYVLVAKLQDRNKELDQANETIVELREGMANVNCEMDRVRVVNRDQKETIDLQDLALLSNERTIANLKACNEQGDKLVIELQQECQTWINGHESIKAKLAEAEEQLEKLRAAVPEDIKDSLDEIIQAAEDNATYLSYDALERLDAARDALFETIVALISRSQEEKKKELICAWNDGYSLGCGEEHLAQSGEEYAEQILGEVK